MEGLDVVYDTFVEFNVDEGGNGGGWLESLFGYGSEPSDADTAAQNVIQERSVDRPSGAEMNNSADARLYLASLVTDMREMQASVAVLSHELGELRVPASHPEFDQFNTLKTELARKQAELAGKINEVQSFLRVGGTNHDELVKSLYSDVSRLENQIAGTSRALKRLSVT